MAQTPTLLDMPDPPSNPDTPSEMPGTPTSTTTSLSALSTTAIKDGHRGAPLPGHHGQHLSANMLEAERADRISRLAGLERVATARQVPGGGSSSQVPQGQIPGYFDANGNPVYTTKMSTVGSASATGSVGGGHTTTWDSGSTRGDDEDGVVERDMDERDQYSQMDQSEDGDGMSDEGNASLVGFGEGAGSTVSGPTYTGSRNLRSSQLSSTEYAERTVMERLDEGEGRRPVIGSADEAGLGTFYFEDKK